MTDPLEQDVPTAAAAEPDVADLRLALDHTCPVCGLHPGQVPATEIAPRLRAAVAQWAAVLARPDVRSRPAPTAWSPLEYGCHVRDVLAVYGARLALQLRADDPLFEDWDQNIAALDGEYPNQDPAEVAAEIAAAGESAARTIEAISGDQWERLGRRVGRDGSFTLLTLAQYILHEVLHHLHNVTS